MSGRFDEVLWQKDDEVRYEGACVSVEGASCLTGSGFALRLTRADSAESDAPTLEWRCKPAQIPVLPAAATHHMGDCEFETTEWTPSDRADEPVLRCDPVTPETPDLPDTAFSERPPAERLFAEAPGIEWAFIHFDCPLPGAHRRLP